jgi:hypothetical protein
VDELTEELIIASGGWHPRYARVLLIQQIGDQAIVLVDGNGDGAEVESERWSRTSRGGPAAAAAGSGRSGSGRCGPGDGPEVPLSPSAAPRRE